MSARRVGKRQAYVAHIRVIISRLELVARELSNAYRQMDRLTTAIGTALEHPGTDPGRTVLATLLSEAHEPLISVYTLGYPASLFEKWRIKRWTCSREPETFSNDSRVSA